MQSIDQGIDQHRRTLLVRTGLLAALGALLVGLGEFLFQYSPRGGYELDSYLYFLDVSPWRLTFGHFLGVLAAPVYLIGYWHIGQMMRPAGRRLSAAVFGLGVYAFAIGAVWLGGRINLALIVQARAGSGVETRPVLDELLTAVSAHNEPLIYIVRALVLIVSVLMAWGILSGRSHYPRAMIILLPAVLLAAIVAGYIYVPEVGVLFLPAAMNISHLIFFLASVFAASRIGIEQGRP